MCRNQDGYDMTLTTLDATYPPAQGCSTGRGVYGAASIFTKLPSTQYTIFLDNSSEKRDFPAKIDRRESARATGGRGSRPSPTPANTAPSHISRTPAIRPDCYRREWISYDEAALISGLAKSTLYGLVSGGAIGKRQRGKYKISNTSLQRYMQRGQSKGA